MKRTKALRAELKKIYKLKKHVDATQIGAKKNDIVQAIHLQNRLKPEERDQEVLKKCVEQLQAVVKERRLRDDFPSFSKFYAYVVDPKNGFTREDIKEL